MELNSVRERIDAIDNELTRLFTERMQTVAEVARVKKATGKAVRDPARERAVVNRVTAQAGDAFAPYVKNLYGLIFELSRNYESMLMGERSPLGDRIEQACREGEGKRLPGRALVACQGTEGAYAQQACEKLFEYPDILYFDSFDGVFNAVEKGMCEFGVLPIENSTAGSVNAVYDLLAQFDFHIVRSLRLKIDHNLLVKPGTKFQDVREVYSHGQAIAQCAGFIETHNMHASKYPNTAMSAEMVANSERTDVAAIASRSCAALYGLEVLEPNIQDSDNNYTRFACISRDLQIFPGADRTSLMVVLPHRPGSLYQVLSRFYALGVNLNKLESRPIPERNFEFMFYFDLETSVYAPQFTQLMGELPELCEDFSYLGSYSEVI